MLHLETRSPVIWMGRKILSQTQSMKTSVSLKNRILALTGVSNPKTLTVDARSKDKAIKILYKKCPNV